MRKAFVLPLVFLASCMMGPDFKPPEVVLSESWEEISKINESWWEVLMTQTF